MPDPHKPRPQRLGRAAILLGLALLSMALLALNRQPIGRAMASWTGEEDAREQIKGTLALVYLRLTRTPPRTDPLVPMAHTGVSPYGVNTFLEQEVEDAKIERSMRLISEAGFSWIRQQFPWEDIEIHAKGDYWDHRWNKSAWDKYDRIVDLAERHDIGIIARLDNPPAWSRAVGNAEGWSMAPPDDYEDFGDYVYAVVSRYRGRIRYYQIWNEPNIYPEWGDQPPDPEGYVRLLQIAYRRAKEADPDCVIIAAGLAQTTENAPPESDPRNLSDLIYLERMYAAGVQGYFDIMGSMVYGLWTGPNDRRTGPERTNYSRAQLVREIMVRNGDGHKPIWATEVGWNALPADFDGAPIYGRVSEEQQAAYAMDAYRRAAREWPWMGVMNYWFFRRPTDLERDQAWYYFRMLEPDFDPLPVYEAFRSLRREPPVVNVGFFQEDHWALRYSGPWEVVDDAAAVLGAYALGQPGATLDFEFAGTDLALVLRDAAHASRLEVMVNGRPTRLSAIRPAPHTDAPSVVVARGLRDGRHEVSVRVLDAGPAGSSGAAGIDGLVVQRRLIPRDIELLGAGLLAIIGSTYALYHHRRRQRNT
jgi:hypothetical protein